jgi:two-component system, sensor histidine kinase and response regulator
VTAKSSALIADDDPTFLLLVEHALEALGRPYVAVENGSEAWELWDRDRHSFCVLDVEMPGLDGLEICRRIRDNDPDRHTYILVVTGRDKAADLEQVLEAGADDYLSKPTTGQRLLARMRIAERRMALDAAHRAMEESLRRARYLAGIGEATVGLKHEINNPLTGILGTAELLLLELRQRAYPTTDVETIITQARRISEIVKRLDDLKDPMSVLYAGGSRMIDLAGTPREKS